MNATISPPGSPKMYGTPRSARVLAITSACVCETGATLTRRVKCVVPADFGRLFGALDLQIHYNRVLPAADHHGLHGSLRTRIQFLVRHIGRDVDKVPGIGLGEVFQIFAPPKSSAAAHDIQHGLEIAMMMRSGLGVRGDHDGPSP